MKKVIGSITQNGNLQLFVAYLGPLATSDESEPNWLEP
jgi:hypothetical protein